MKVKLIGRVSILAITICALTPNVSMAAGCASQSTAEIAKWFEQYAAAWKGLNPAGASALYSKDATYQEDPFASPIQGEEQIRKYWDDVAHGQHDVDVNYEVLSSCGTRSIVHWHASFSREPSGQRVELDGIAEIILDKMGKCIQFREWWDRKQSK